ncbi:MAG: carboxypeptidase regulatory-like domain-containing protein [Bacteriovoracaceae bacterium]
MLAGLLPYILLFALASCGESSLTSADDRDGGVSSSCSGTGDISGKVSDASDGSAISDATVTHVSSGDTDTTDGSGNYSFTGLSDGNHVFTFAQGTYTSQSVTVTIDCNETANGNVSLLNATLSTNKITIVLSWGTSPSDLDSHLYIPQTASSTYHRYYANKNTDTNIDAAPFSNLDYDHTGGTGPETITVRFQSSATDYPRTYRYFVNNYSHSNNGSNDHFKDSEAVVRVYKDGTLSNTFNVSTSDESNYWHVFDMSSNGTITSKNLYSDTIPDKIYE